MCSSRCREDVDTGMEALENEVKRKIQNKAIVYHIHHPKNYPEDDVIIIFQNLR
jgi:hypothetical protein